MGSVTLIGGGIIVCLALLNDPSGAIKLVTAIITVRGVAWLSTKITAINKDASEIIDFTGWSIAGVAIVKLLKLSVRGLPEILQRWQEIENNFRSIGQWIEKVIPG